MTVLIDASALLHVIRTASEEEALKLLSTNHVLDLTKYEVGNTLWKEHTLLHTLTRAEFEEFLTLFGRLMEKIPTLSPAPESLLSIGRLASQTRLSFYAASYIHLARSHHLTLVTTDETLARAATRYVKTLPTKDLVQSAK